MKTSPSLPAAEQRRVRVRAAVRELLAEQGFRISMDDVAVRAGCSKQTLYSQFGNKQELMRSVIGEHLDLATAWLDPAMEDPRDALLAFARQHLAHLCDPTVVAACQLLTAEAHQFPQEAQALYREGCDTLQQRLAAWLQRAMDQGRLRHDEPHYAAELLLGMMVGLDFERQRFGVPHRAGDKARQRWAEFAVDTFLRAFSPDANASGDARAVPPGAPGRRIRNKRPLPKTSKNRNGASP